MTLWNPTYWSAVGETLAAVGTVWQTRAALLDSVESMDQFLTARNTLFLEERSRIRSSIPSWRPLRRRQAARVLLREIGDALSADERRLMQRFDRQTLGWSALSIAAFLLSVVSWSQVRF